MADHADLNTTIIDNLADLEAAAHQIDDVIVPLIEADLGRIVGDVIDKRGWGGEFGSLDEFWFAPAAWADPDGDDSDYVCHFEIDTVPRSERERDYFSLSALTGAGLTKMGLFWASEAVRPAQLGRMIAGQPGLVTQLQSLGFVYDIGDRHALYLPLQIDRAQLSEGLQSGALETALDGFAAALDTAVGAVSLFESLVRELRKAEG